VTAAHRADAAVGSRRPPRRWYNRVMAVPCPAPTPSPTLPSRPLAAWLAGRIDHARYAALAEQLAWEVSEPGGRCPTLVVCELESAITIGRHGSRTDVRFTDDDLRSRRLAVRFTGRGGGAVLHAPGQMFVALFASLEDLGLGRHDIGAYVARLEAGLAAALRTTRCDPHQVTGRHGIFGRSGLLAAVAVAIRRGVAWHGAFVNVSPALEPFHRVRTVPVGTGTMGSIEADVRRRIRPTDARTALVRGIGDAFGFARTNLHAGFPLRTEPRPLPEVLHHVG
jgi:lipoyl(octanoyl) transferase